MKLKNPLFFAASLAAIMTAQAAHAQSKPAWKSYQVTGNPADMIRSTAVADWLGLKVDVANGTLTSPTITDGTATDLALSAPSITGGTLSASTLSTPTITGGTASNLVLTTPSLSDAANLSVVGNNSLYVNPVGLGTRHVYSSIFSDDTATDGTKSIWPHVLQVTSSTGYGTVDPEWGGEADRIDLFLGAKCLSGSSSCWAENQLLYAGPGFEAAGHGSEIDLENESSDRDPSVSGTKTIQGMEITGITKYPVSYGIDIVGAGTDVSTNSPYLTHDAIAVLGGAAKDNSFVDVSSSSESVHIMGTHGIGVDLSTATITGSAILLDSSQAIVFRNSSTGSQFYGLTSDGADTVVGPTSPTNNIGYGGGNGSAFLSVSDNVATVETLAAVGTQADINLSLAAKGSGSVVAVSPLAVTAISASTSMQAPVVTTAPTGTCTAGQMEVSGTGFHVCVAGAWKTATLN